ncbi:hypothetical protein MUCCIDRAFT_81735 [Mucor lusitanicus CBS 277.49]|uniref:Uncharacterized protein n=1 Tax=Mucor lusitanicus CBS 277.49 TaxID=747725 RepID=A0A168LNH5_MUCCL|nr:hypothetical protein MUCCIDRAFT_81735 [Mucor lusitanicus CBS 277.49]
MSIFQPKPSIQLSSDQESGNSAPQRPPAFPRKSSSSWSIPCCSHISLGKSGGRIQLPDDSDEDSADEEYNQPSTSPFNAAYNEDTQSPSLPNAFSQAQARSQTALSRNPFARVDEEPQSKTAERQITPQAVRQADSFIPEASGEEELASFTQSRFAKYDNEPDWTEAYKDDSDEDDEHIEPTIKGFQIQNEEAEIKENGKSDISKNTLNTQTTHTVELRIMPTEQTNDISSSVTRSTVEEEEIQTEKEDKVPQIEKEVLHLLPLPELSNEIPPAMIHKKASFEKSMYGEQPLMSVGRNQGSRISRFSMTEEDYLALKKAEEEEKRISSLNVRSTSSSTLGTQNPSKTADQEHPPAIADTKPQEEAVKDDRRASIAQSILGDKLDDFTEKLAFIKKNIIMSIDSDEEDDEEISAEKILQKMEQVKSTTSASNPNSSISDQKPPPTLHRRTSSLMDAVPTIARFMNQIGGGSPATPESSTSTNVPLSSSQTSTSSFSPSSLFSALAGPMPEPSSTSASNKKASEKRAIQEEDGSGNDDAEEEEEELFDFTKVLEIGKNVKTFGEGFVGNGIRMFNDVATRVKTTVEEEQKRAAAQISAQRNESTSTASSSNNENEWMHNYL